MYVNFAWDCAVVYYKRMFGNIFSVKKNGKMNLEISIESIKVKIVSKITLLYAFSVYLEYHASSFDSNSSIRVFLRKLSLTMF